LATSRSEFSAASARQQHRALAAIARFVERAAALFQQRQRGGPVAVLAARFKNRPAGPAERRRGARGFLGMGSRAFVIVAAVRFDEQAMQAERLGVGATGHGAKRALGAVAVAAELGCLRAQQ
jgi:hypothetical protein